MNIIDIIIIILVIIITVTSARKGFLLSLLNIAAYFISGILSRILSMPCTNFIYENYISKRIISELYEIMPSGTLSGELNTVVENLLDSVSPYFASIIKQFNFIPDFANTGGADLTVGMIEETYIMPIVTNIISIVVTLLLFIVLSVILRIVFYFIDKAVTSKKHSVLRKSNMFLGAVLGFIKSLFPAGIICGLLIILSPFIDNESFAGMVRGSFFCDFIAQILR